MGRPTAFQNPIPEFAIYIGVGLSLLMYLKRTSHPGVDDVKPVPGQMPPAFSASTGLPDCPQLRIVRINGPIFFGAASHLQDALQRIAEQNPAHTHVLLVASGINFVDLTGAQMLGQEARRRRTLGGALYRFNLKDEPLGMLRRSGMLDAINAENFFTMGDDVMAAIKTRLNPTTCANCTVRVFGPCKGQGRKNAPRSGVLSSGLGSKPTIGLPYGLLFKPKNAMETAILSSKGQLVIPKTVRDDAHIATGTRLEVRYVDGEIRLRPLADRTATGLAQVAGCLYRPQRQRLSDADTQAAIRAKLKARNAP